jgi:hypothetical protein
MRRAEAEPTEGAQSEVDAAACDEEFLKRVDRAMFARKQADPYRLDDVERAVQEESRLASLTNAYGIDRSSDRGRNQTG